MLNKGSALVSLLVVAMLFSNIYLGNIDVNSHKSEIIPEKEEDRPILDMAVDFTPPDIEEVDNEDETIESEMPNNKFNVSLIIDENIEAEYQNTSDVVEEDNENKENELLVDNRIVNIKEDENKTENIPQEESNIEPVEEDPDPVISWPIYGQGQNLLQICSGVEATPEDWPMLGHDVMHTQLSPSLGVVQPQLAWVREDLWIRSPIVVNGVVYGAGRKYVDNEILYTVVALRDADGSTIWSYDIPWYNNFRGDRIYSFSYGAPLYYKGLLAVGTRGQTGLRFFNADTGELIWYLKCGGVDSSPIAADDMVFAGTQEGYVIAVDLTDGSIEWTFKIHGGSTSYPYRLYSRIMHSSPAYYEGKLYITAEDGYIYCLNSSSGELIWDFFHDDLCWSSPTITDGKVIFGNHGSYIFALNLSSGEMIWNTTILTRVTWNGWNFSFRDSITISPAVLGSGIVITIGRSTFLLEIETGEIIWQYKHTVKESLPTSLTNPAVSSNGLVYTGIFSYQFFCLNGSQCKQMWNMTSSTLIYTSPVLYKNCLYMEFNETLCKFINPTF